MDRPKRNESEEDLLKFEAEFLAGRSAPAAKVERIAKSKEGSEATETSEDTLLLADQTQQNKPNSWPAVSRKEHIHGKKRDVVDLKGL